jgi:hypothetical protein
MATFIVGPALIGALIVVAVRGAMLFDRHGRVVADFFRDKLLRFFTVATAFGVLFVSGTTTMAGLVVGTEGIEGFSLGLLLRAPIAGVVFGVVIVGGAIVGTAGHPVVRARTFALIGAVPIPIALACVGGTLFTGGASLLSLVAFTYAAIVPWAVAAIGARWIVPHLPAIDAFIGLPPTPITPALAAGALNLRQLAAEAKADSPIVVGLLGDGKRVR